MDKVNEYSELASQKDSQLLRAIVEDETQAEAYRLAAIWELERRNEATEEIFGYEERLRKGWETMRQRRAAPNKYNTFWPRFLAGILDGLVLMAVFALPTFGFAAVIDDLVLTWYYDLIFDLLVYVYYVIMHAKYGQTLGKMAMRVKVVRNSDEGAIGFRRAFMRDLVPIALILVTFVANIAVISFDLNYTKIDFVMNISTLWLLAEIITMLTNAKRRAVHDYMAGTVVIRTQ